VNARDFTELDRLLNRLVDGGLSAADETQLDAWLRDDAAARDWYRRFMLLHADLQWDHGVSVGLVSHEKAAVTAAAVSVLSREPTRWMWSSFAKPAAMWLAVGLLVVGLLLSWRLRGDRQMLVAPAPAPSIMTLDAIQGTADWRDGTTTLRLVDGSESRRLAAGTLFLEGDDSSCQLRFEDGTRVTVSGNAEAVFEQDSQKRLRLRRGSLSADVARQPEGCPLVIETPTARVEVIGTLFTLVADGEQTALDVERGSVRLQRLVDGRQVEVHDQRRAVASLDASAEMQAVQIGIPPAAWRQTFDQPPPSICKGTWIAGEGEQPSRVRGVPCVARRKTSGEPIVHHGITARSGVETQLVTLQADSVLRVRYRLTGEAPLRIMLGTNHPGGSFAGNFEVKLGSQTGMVDADGWRTLTVPLSGFQSLIKRFPKPQDGSQVSLVMFNSHEHDVGLEVCEIEICPRSP